MAAGPVVAWMIAALEGAAAVGGLSAVGAVLYSIGIPKNNVLHYEASLKNGRYMLVCHGTPDAVTRAHAILAGCAETQLYLAEAPATGTCLSISFWQTRSRSEICARRISGKLPRQPLTSSIRFLINTFD